MVSNGEYGITCRMQQSFGAGAGNEDWINTLGWSCVLSTMTRRSRFLLALAVLLLIVLAGLWYSIRNRFGGMGRPPAVVLQIQQLKQLVSVRYSIQRVVGVTEPKLPFGEESLLLIVQGDVLAGVDLGKLTPADVYFPSPGKAIIRLPPAKLMDTFIDEKQVKVWDRHITWWTPWVPFNPDLEHRARLQALNEITTAALNMGILDQAQSQAERAIKQFLGAFHLEVSFEKQSV
jgi:hypothetical protein